MLYCSVIREAWVSAVLLAGVRTAQHCLPGRLLFPQMWWDRGHLTNTCCVSGTSPLWNSLLQLHTALVYMAQFCTRNVLLVWSFVMFISCFYSQFGVKFCVSVSSCMFSIL